MKASVLFSSPRPRRLLNLHIHAHIHTYMREIDTLNTQFERLII